MRAGRVWRRRHIWKQQVSAGKRQFSALSQATSISLVGVQNKPPHPHQQRMAAGDQVSEKSTSSPVFQAFLLTPGSNNANYDNPQWFSQSATTSTRDTSGRQYDLEARQPQYPHVCACENDRKQLPATCEAAGTVRSQHATVTVNQVIDCTHVYTTQFNQSLLGSLLEPSLANLLSEVDNE